MVFQEESLERFFFRDFFRTCYKYTKLTRYTSGINA